MKRPVCDGGGFGHEFRLILRRARQTWRLVPARHKLALGGAAGVMALTSAAGTAIPLLLGRLVDRVKGGTEQGIGRDALYRVAALYLGLIAGAYLLRELLHVLRRYLVESTCTRVDRDMTVRLVAHLLKIDLCRLTHEKVGALHGRISRSVDGFVRFLRLSFLDLFPALLTGGFALAAVVGKEPWLALVMLGVVPASLLLTVRQLISQKGVRLDLMRTRELLDGTVVEQLGGIEYVRAADTHRFEVRRIANAAESRRAKEVRHHFQMSLFGCAKALNEGLFHVLVLSFSIYLAVQGAMSFGDVLMFSMLFLNVMTPLAEVHRVIDEGHECSLRVGDLLEMLAVPVDRSFATAARPEVRCEGRVPAVRVEGLRAEYRTGSGRVRPVLDGVSVTVYRGETVGVAGRSGCGKSTFLKVLLRMVHPGGGRVELAGVPLEEVSREAIGRLVGYVGQSPFMFAGTIAENIAYGIEGASMRAVREAAKRAAVHRDIMAMPGGYQARVLERGQNLSGGQKQRIALARVFLKDPPILVLDESTSALDNVCERRVQRALAEARADRTIILVAHRLSTLVNTDRIFVFEDGRVAEAGTFEELVLGGGVFAELVRSGLEGQGVPGSPVRTEVIEAALGGVYVGASS